ncbi:MAG: protein translocase subunit SecF [Nitrospinae bacterium]|nr:protein translocase subunit SecF [Nitrospinota bacterium]
MQFLKKETNIDFLSKRKIAFGVSFLMVAISIISLAAHGGPNYGVDFKGGTIVQVKFRDATPISQVRDVVGSLKMGDFSIQEYGSAQEMMIRVPVIDEAKSGETQAQKVETALRQKFGAKFSVERVEMVGPKVGSDLRWKALLAVFYSMIGILIYLAFRFEFRFAVGAVLATIHDPLVILGAFSVLDKEFTLTVLAAVLTIIGYSLNDTIVVFDRIRENLRLKRGMPIEALLNLSVNQTLSRTILTSGFTMLVVVALFFLGGEVIHDFAFALMVGIVVGTYSSIYVASPIILYWEQIVLKKKEAASKAGAVKAKKKKEGQ